MHCAYRPVRRRSRLVPVVVASLLGLGFVAGRLGSRADAAPPPAPTIEERVAYWIDRIVLGPDPTAVSLPNFHQGLLMDAERNLAAAPEATAARLDDEAFRRRIETQHDPNPRLGLLAVLARIGAKRPQTALRWGTSAVADDELLVRRAGTLVLVATNDPASGPALVNAFRRDPTDRMIAATSVRGLLALGPPWDAAAARVVLEYGVADLGASSSIWEGFLSAAGESASGARDEVVAWWSLLAQAAGPRAPRPRGERGTTGREPTSVLSLRQGLFAGETTAARARAWLARDAMRPSAADRAAVRDSVRALIERLRAPGARVEDVVAAVRALDGDEDPSVADLLLALLRATPAAPDWRDALLATFDALRARHVDIAEYVGELLRSGDPARLDLAFLFARRGRSASFIAALEALEADPRAARSRLAARRELVFLYAVAASAPTDAAGPEREATTAARAARIATWIADPSDPSGQGFAASLFDLGPEGEAEFARGLAGPIRPAYVAALMQMNDRYVGSDVVRALLAPIGRDTPPAERRDAWTAAFLVGSAESLPEIEEAAARLRDDARDEAETILRIVRHRIPIRP